MKNSNQIARFLLGTIVLVTLAEAACGESFNLTNCLAGGLATTGWPTNTVSTNGLPQQTGGAVPVVNQEWVGFYFQCLPLTNSGTSTVTVQLVRSGVSDPPQVVFSTNGIGGTNVFLTRCDWETTPAITLTIPVAGTNGCYWFTNLDRTVIGGANWVGVYSVSNYAGGGSNVSYLTNVVAGLARKIIPVRFP